MKINPYFIRNLENLIKIKNIKISKNTLKYKILQIKNGGNFTITAKKLI